MTQRKGITRGRFHRMLNSINVLWQEKCQIQHFQVCISISFIDWKSSHCKETACFIFITETKTSKQTKQNKTCWLRAFCKKRGLVVWMVSITQSKCTWHFPLFLSSLWSHYRTVLFLLMNAESSSHPLILHLPLLPCCAERLFYSLRANTCSYSR